MFKAKTFTKKEFDALHAIVHAVVTQGYKGDERIVPRFVLVTDDHKQLPYTERQFLLAGEDSFMGLTWTRGFQTQAIIWIDPTIDNDRDRYITILHELAHAYNLNSAGYPVDDHGPAWRRIFGLALGHWQLLTGRQDLIPYATMYRRDEDFLKLEENKLYKTVYRTHAKIYREVEQYYGGGQ